MTSTRIMVQLFDSLELHAQDMPAQIAKDGNPGPLNDAFGLSFSRWAPELVTLHAAVLEFASVLEGMRGCEIAGLLGMLYSYTNQFEKCYDAKALGVWLNQQFITTERLIVAAGRAILRKAHGNVGLPLRSSHRTKTVS